MNYELSTMSSTCLGINQLQCTCTWHRWMSSTCLCLPLTIVDSWRCQQCNYWYYGLGDSSVAIRWYAAILGLALFHYVSSCNVDVQLFTCLCIPWFFSTEVKVVLIVLQMTLVIGIVFTLSGCVWLFFISKTPLQVIGPSILIGAGGSVLIVTSLAMTTDIIGVHKVRMICVYM